MFNEIRILYIHNILLIIIDIIRINIPSFVKHDDH